MKKKTALVLTLAMVFSLAPLSAYAETITTGGGAAALSLSGALGSTTADNTKIGTITVTLN